MYKKTKQLRECIANKKLDPAKVISNGIFMMQLHPYHSIAFNPKRYKDILYKKLKSFDYTSFLLYKITEKAKEPNSKKIILCMRSYDEWNTIYKSININTNIDLKQDLKNSFKLLRYLDSDKNHRSPFFNENFIGKDLFNNVIETLIEPLTPSSNIFT